MPATNFPEYARVVTETIEELIATGQARLDQLQIDQRSVWLGFIAGIPKFDDDSELHLRDYVDVTLSQPKVMVMYHYQDAERQLIFRCDNATHRPPLTVAEYKHALSALTITPAPTLA